VRTIDKTIKPIKTTLQRPVFLCLPYMPLPCHIRTISSTCQYFCEGNRLAVQVSLIGGIGPRVHHVSYPRLVGIYPCKQRSSGRATARSVVKICHLNTSLCHTIQIGRVYFGSKTA